jgi:hypothetical protein
VLATAACFGALPTASAQAFEWAHRIRVGGGGNAFGPSVRLYASETRGAGAALGCAGIRGITGVVCESTAGEAVVVVLGGDVTSEPYIHNHSTFEGLFNGFYYS